MYFLPHCIIFCIIFCLFDADIVVLMQKLLQLHDCLLGHFFVDVVVAVEGTGILDVAGNLGYQIA